MPRRRKCRRPRVMRRRWVVVVVVKSRSSLDGPRMLVDDLRLDGRRRIVVGVSPCGLKRWLPGIPAIFDAIPMVHVHVGTVIVVCI